MSKYIPLDKAAEMLGVSVERVNEMRSKQEIFGYKDGATWKFKLQELERVAGEISGLSLNKGLEGADDDLDFELSDSSHDLIRDGSSSDSLADDSMDELLLEESSDDLSLADSGADILASDEKVTDEDALSFGSSSLKLSGSSKKLNDGSADLLDDESLGGDSPSDTGKMLGENDDLLLSEDDLFSDEQSLHDSFEDSAELSSDFEDSDLVLDDSDSSSELQLGASDSGVSLAPNESGISLDESLELGGSDIDSLELPEDDDMIVLDESSDPDSATIMQEDDFNLTPLEEAIEDDSSGSQIIALEDSEVYTDESSATILADSDDLESQPAMLEDSAAFGGEMMVGGGMAAGAIGSEPIGAPALPESPYTILEIGSLMLVTVLLIPGAMIAYDLARNLWMPDDQVVQSSLLNFFLTMTGMNN